jgi:hypothetical protein
MVMDKSQKRVRPGFLLGLLVIFAICGWLISSEIPTDRDRTKAKITRTLVEERLMAEMLTEQAVKLGGLTNLANEFILSAIRTTNEPQYSFASRTNALGRVVDHWQTPFQIDLVALTNFTIRSAGPNLKFGDADDIIFNSALNEFAKP